jgi:flagellar L-ring protein precursor FlgH
MSQINFQTKSRRALGIIVTCGLLTGLLGGCNMLGRIENVGGTPNVSNIQNPLLAKGYRPVSLPMPKQRKTTHATSSLWRPGARAFFKDQRASEIGDIVTVTINIGDKAKLANTSKRSRDAEQNAAKGTLGGLEDITQKLFKKLNPLGLVGIDTDSTTTGTGSVDRSEEIDLTIAAIVTQVLPNGNLVLRGTQEVLVNFENRILRITGVVRPEDISATNKISHTQIAEARIAYGGRGQLTDVQQPRYGQQLFDIIFPF